MTTILILLFALLAAFQIKHFLCDYPLQTPYMLGKFKAGYAWVWPLTAHAGVHAAGTLIIAGACLLLSLLASAQPLTVGFVLSLAAIDFMAHWIIDRAKVVLGSYPQTDKKFWWALGLDQMLHHFTHYTFIALLILSLL